MPSFNVPRLPEVSVFDRRYQYDSHIMCTLNGRFGDLSNQFKKAELPLTAIDSTDKAS